MYRLSALYEKGKILLLILSYGHFSLLAGECRRRFYSREMSYGLHRDLTAPIKPIEGGIKLLFRKMRENDISKILGREGKEPENGNVKEHLVQMKMVSSKIQSCYVAEAEFPNINIPCHMLWLITPEENDKVRTFFKGGFPPLADDEVLLEGVYTFTEFRKKGIFASALDMACEEASTLGAKWATAFVRCTNLPSLKGFKKRGFAPYIMREDSWILFSRRSKFRFPTEYDIRTFRNI